MAKERTRIGERIQNELEEQERNKKHLSNSRRSSSQSSAAPDNLDDSSSVESAELLDEQATYKLMDGKSPEALAEKDPEFKQFRDACLEIMENP